MKRVQRENRRKLQVVKRGGDRIALTLRAGANWRTPRISEVEGVDRVVRVTTDQQIQVILVQRSKVLQVRHRLSHYYIIESHRIEGFFTPLCIHIDQ